MASKYIIGLLLLAAGIFWINHSGTKEPVADHKPTPLHIILGLDPSGSTGKSGWPWPGKSFFESQVQFLEDRGGGVLEVYNFSHSIPQPVRIKIRAIGAVPDIYSGENEVKKAEKHNQSISSENQMAKERFWKNLEDRILNYQPTKSNDFTYVVINCSAIRLSLSLPQYHDFSQYVLLYSDLIDDVPGQKPKPLTDEHIGQLASLSQLSICNYRPNNSDYQQLGATSLPDYHDFIELIQLSTKTLN